MEYVEHGRKTVDGWFNLDDALLFALMNDLQEAEPGDLLEIGAYRGRSAILLGYFARRDERVVVIDLFGQPAADSEQRAEQDRWYRDLGQRSFESNYERFHRTPAHVLVGRSDERLPDLVSSTMRFIHIDGSHEFEAVRSDITEAVRLATPNAVIVMDDVTTRHTPGVGAAVWEAIAAGRLVPLVQTVKMYATVPGSTITVDAIRAALQRHALAEVETHGAFGHPILEVRSTLPPTPRPLRERVIDNALPPAVLKLWRRIRA